MLVLIDHRDVVGSLRHLLAEHGYDGGVRVQRLVGLVEAVKNGALALGADVYVAQIGLAQETFQRRLITLQELADEGLRVFAGIVLCSDMALVADGEGHQIKRRGQGVVADLYNLHGLAHQLGDIQQEAVPYEYGVGLQAEVGHQVGIGIDVVLSAAVHLLLAGSQEVEHGGVVGEFGVDGQRLHRHTRGMEELGLGTSVIHRGEQCFLLVVVFRQEVGVCGIEKGALFDAVGLAEGTDALHIGAEDAEQMGVRAFGNLAVG